MIWNTLPEVVARPYVIGNAGQQSIARILGSVSYVSDTGDFWRRQGEKYPRHLSRFTGEPAYFHHIETAVPNLFTEFDAKATDFQYAVFHQPNPRFPVEGCFETRLYHETNRGRAFESDDRKHLLG